MESGTIFLVGTTFNSILSVSALTSKCFGTHRWVYWHSHLSVDICWNLLLSSHSDVRTDTLKREEITTWPHSLTSIQAKWVFFYDSAGKQNRYNKICFTHLNVAVHPNTIWFTKVEAVPANNGQARGMLGSWYIRFSASGPQG